MNETNLSSGSGDAPPTGDSSMDDSVVRPRGAWVVAGFLVCVILLMWGLVSCVFVVRS